MKELEPLINQLTEIIKGTKDFTLSQAPDFVRQYLIKSMTEAIAGIVLSVPIFIGSVFLFKYGMAGLKEYEDEASVCLLVSGSAICFSFIVVCVNIHDLLIIWLAPKVWIVENMVKMMKGGNG